MPMSKEFVLRFAVGNESGVRSALWRVWRNGDKDDIYIAPSGITSDGNIAGIAKISLHTSRKCIFGFTSQYKRVIGGSDDRSIISWERKEGPEDGFTAAVSVLIPSNFLSRQATPYGKELSLMKPPRKDSALVIDMTIHSRAHRSMGTLVPSSRTNPSYTFKWGAFPCHCWLLR